MKVGRQSKADRALYLECARALKKEGALDYEIAAILDVHPVTLSRWRRAGWIR